MCVCGGGGTGRNQQILEGEQHKLEHVSKDQIYWLLLQL